MYVRIYVSMYLSIYLLPAYIHMIDGRGKEVPFTRFREVKRERKRLGREGEREWGER